MNLTYFWKFVLAFFLIGGLYQFIQQRQSIYQYDVSKSYTYDFSKSDASIFDLQIKDSEIILPVLNQDWDTALLSVEIKRLPLGFLFQPSIEISSGNEQIKQTFEHGASGIRYLNLSRFIVSKQQKIHIEGHYLAFADSRVHLSLFAKRASHQPRLLVISPHPDDAEIAAWGLYSNSQSYIATLTAGESGKNTYNEIYPNPHAGHIKKGELRVWDSLFVPFLGGVPPDHTVNLGYFDGTLDKMYANKASPVISEDSGIQDILFFRSKNVSKLLARSGVVAPTWESLVNDLAHLLTEIKPDIIVAPYPALEHHPDHKYASIALFAAIKKLNLKEGQLYLYSNHCVHNDFYPYGETGDPVSLPPNFVTSPYFVSVYSHPLNNNDRNNKLFALEAMHDLRLDAEWLKTSGALKVFGNSLKKYLSGYDKSYFRRAVRDNELFFVLPAIDIYNDTVCESLQGLDKSLIQRPPFVLSLSKCNF